MARPRYLKYKKLTRDTVTLEWEPEEMHDGIEGFLIEQRDLRKPGWTPVQRVKPIVGSYEVPGLVSGRQYLFRVRTVGNGGHSEPVELPQPIVPASIHRKHL